MSQLLIGTYRIIEQRRLRKTWGGEGVQVKSHDPPLDPPLGWICPHDRLKVGVGGGSAHLR